ncbi:MAG TPA: DUF5107 domain-containing protein, partial [Flavisolibacter sp.]|nr:DUF5107 domain-containing protein [Flavisolibacter sp.]
MTFFKRNVLVFVCSMIAFKLMARPVHPPVNSRVYDQYVLTHLLTPAGPVPTAFDPNGVYPYQSFSETSNRPVPKKYRFVELENEHLK